MASSTFLISPVEEADVPAMANLIRLNWLDEAIAPFVFPDCFTNPSRMYESFISFASKRLPDLQFEFVKGTDTSTGKFLAFGAWSLENDREQAEEQADEVDNNSPATQTTSPKEHSKFYAATLGVAVEKFKPLMKGIKHFDLVNLNVASEYQRKGLGTLIVRKCLARADEAGLPVYVMSMPAARDFYLRLGFEEKDYFEFDLTDWAVKYRGYGKFRVYAMLRPVGKTLG